MWSGPKKAVAETKPTMATAFPPLFKLAVSKGQSPLLVVLIAFFMQVGGAAKRIEGVGRRTSSTSITRSIITHPLPQRLFLWGCVMPAILAASASATSAPTVPPVLLPV